MVRISGKKEVKQTLKRLRREKQQRDAIRFLNRKRLERETDRLSTTSKW